MTTPQARPAATAQRASDTDREHTAARLRDAVGEGRLTLAEADDRIAAAYTAVHHHDLAALTADLPADLPAPPEPSTPSARHRPPLLPVILLLVTVAWIASPLPFPWPVLLVGFLIHRGVQRRRLHRA
jgi:hypothetical protein